ncbi:thiol reductant ABC exporter subunit CydC [Texcoconibacillus texcoconensis]|uniref:ATP-binding cassette subfamily C protein CydC n=1 Tax=Texcoconibacillus texcoconensis TaxID=1095777 RepID=A0A840QMH7_9BACI|nr:thiol reductant ABC exporter subunit CydC [Texcoconibacillus texcoconensis]MBB5172579.1 ATP-binding cassette subfamily C protein CydC [Texcoconibacillus texcoconensis]
MKDLSLVIKLMMAEKKDIFYSVLLGVLAGIGAVGLFAASGYLISISALTPPLYILTIMIAVLQLFSISRAVSRYGERYFSHRATFTMLSNLRVHFYNKLEPLAPRIFHKYQSGDLLSRIVGDVESLQNFFLRVFYPPIVMVIVFLSTIVFTAWFSFSVAIVLILGLVLTGFLIPAFFALRRRRLASEMREKRGELSTEVTEFLYGFRDLKIHQQLASQEEALTTSSEKYIQEQEQSGIHTLYSQSLNQMVSFIVTWSIVAIGAYLVTEGSMEGVFLAMLIMISLTVFEDSTPMAAFPSHYEDSRRATSRLLSVVDDPAEAVQAEETKRNLDTEGAFPIEINNVSFAYEREGRNMLEDVSLSLPAGSKTAIVGPSGSGKSTLIQLLLKVYPVQEGDILIDGVPLNDVSEESMWQGANAVLQDNHFFYGTIRDNLQLAGDELTDEDMEAVLEKVKLHSFSVIDSVLEKGENLSGGEKQRLAMARAMLKGAPLWLLDEPTSSLDTLTEQDIYDQLFAQAEDDTVVLVSHRLTGLERMDQIIVMDRGKIIESGTYEELMERRGYFYELKQIEKSVLM